MVESTKWLRFILRWGVILAVVWLFLRWFEWRSTFFPTREISLTPSQCGMPFENVSFTSRDGVKLHGWFVPAAGSRLTLLFCHGNGGNISHRIDKLMVLHQLGVSVFIFDYRGYGQSEGWPNERGTYLDAQAANEWLRTQKSVSSENLVIYGESLGGAVAVDLAVQQTCRGLVLESTFTCLPDMAKAVYPWVPLHLLCSIRYDSIHKVSALKAPLLMFHSTEDDIIPFALAEKLYAAAPEPKRFVKLRGGHNDATERSEGEYREGMKEFFQLLR